MKYIVFVFVLFLASPLLAQDSSELNYSPMSELDNGVATVENKPVVEKKKIEEALKEKPTTQKSIKPINACSANKIKYLQSASRKLYRAISGKGYKIKKLGFENLKVGDKNFEIIPEREGKVLALHNSSHPFGYIAINTTRGHIIAKMKWKNCNPVASRIVSPRVSVPSVDMEPFKYWGLRVLWTLPNSFAKSKNIKDSLIKVIKAD